MIKYAYHSDELLEEMKIRINNLDVGLKRFSHLITPIYSKAGASGIPGRHGLPLPYSLVDSEMNKICYDLHFLEICLENMENCLDKDLLKELSEKS